MGEFQIDDLDLDLDADESAGKPPGKSVETVIVMVANGLWAVVGLVLWIPQVVRVLLTSAVRLVHSALTRQPASYVRGPIRDVSSFYADGFLSTRSVEAPGMFRPRELRPWRLLGEVLWAAAFYLILIELVSRPLFDRIAAAMADWLTAAWTGLVRLGGWLKATLPGSAQGFDALGWGGWLMIGVLAVLAFLGGAAFASRRR